MLSKCNTKIYYGPYIVYLLSFIDDIFQPALNAVAFYNPVALSEYDANNNNNSSFCEMKKKKRSLPRK